MLVILSSFWSEKDLLSDLWISYFSNRAVSTLSEDVCRQDPLPSLLAGSDVSHTEFWRTTEWKLNFPSLSWIWQLCQVQNSSVYQLSKMRGYHAIWTCILPHLTKDLLMNLACYWGLLIAQAGTQLSHRLNVPSGSNAKQFQPFDWSFQTDRPSAGDKLLRGASFLSLTSWKSSFRILIRIWGHDLRWLPVTILNPWAHSEAFLLSLQRCECLYLTEA